MAQRLDRIGAIKPEAADRRPEPKDLIEVEVLGALRDELDREIG